MMNLILHKLLKLAILLKHKILELWPAVRDLLVAILNNELHLTLGFKLFLILLSFIILGLFLNFFFQNNFIFIGEYIKNKFSAAFIAGLLVLPLAVLLTLVLIGTTVGVLFIPALLFIFVFYFFFAFYTVALVIGEQFVKAFTFRDHPYFELFCGTNIIFLLLCIPYVGPGLVFIFLLAGLGAVVKLKFGVR
jgi:hypothetical protein